MTSPAKARTTRCLALLPLLLLLGATACFGQSLFNQNASSTFAPSPAATFLPAEQAYRLSITVEQQQLQLHWSIAPGYYLYKDRFQFKDAASQNPIAANYPQQGLVKYDDYFEKELEVFYDQALVNLNIDSEPFILQITSQGCADAGLCHPPQIQYFAIDPARASAIEQAAPAATVHSTAAPADGSTSLFIALLLAAAGGVLLNLMPCVFPVLSIKALSLAKSGGNHLPAHGWAYSAGAVVTFTAIAALMLSARAGGEAIGWGFQLQSPLTISLLVYLFFTMGLSLSGLVDFGTSLMGIGSSLTSKRGLRGSFFTGALASVVASPCTAPFMASALGYALTQPAGIALGVFAALGFGMALPFLLLCHIPHLARHLPEPGPWMESLKQLLAFPMYLSAIWLLWVLGRQTDSDAVAKVLIGLTLIGFGLWLLRQQFQPKLRLALALSAIIGAIVIGYSAGNGKTEDHSIWQTYSPQALSTARASGQPVFVNLTADWCITCLANERITLDSDETLALFEQHHVIALKGDWTNYDADITSLLNQYQRSGVPLYLMYLPGQERAQVLPQLLRIKHLRQALKSKSHESR